MELKKVLKYRNIFMALAILWIIFYHMKYTINIPIIKFIKNTGYGGVDIFIFASGIGCFYSLYKNENINGFIKRRIKKLMPTFWVFILFFIAYRLFNKTIGIRSIIGNILCVESFAFNKHEFNWYISCIWLFYFLAPYLYFYTKNIKSHFKAFLFLILLLLFTLPFMRNDALIIMVTRLPLFFLGIYFGKLINEDYKLSKTQLILSILIMIIGIFILKYSFIYYKKLLGDYGLYWYPFILITPPLCIIISSICDLINKNKVGKFILKIFDKLGTITFELYLVHVLIFEIVRDMLSNKTLNNNILLWIISTLISFILAIGLKYLTKLILLLLNKIHIKKLA